MIEVLAKLQSLKKEETMAEIMTIGMDLAKQVNHVIGVDSLNREVLKKKLRRKQVLDFFANLPPCSVAMEACGGAHEWGRRLQALGHRVTLISPKLVKSYVQGNKNDYNDARAIVEASRRAGLRPVAVKTRDQQDMQALHRLRESRISERTALSNQIRGLLAEYGIVLGRGIAQLRTEVPTILEDADNGLSGLFRELLAYSFDQLRKQDAHVAYYTHLIQRQASVVDAQKRLQSVPGYGPIVASVFHSKVGDGQAFKCGRDVSAAIGLVPAQHSSGDRSRLMGISKRGDRYLRALLVHGARSVVKHAPNRHDALSRWIQQLIASRGTNKATVALANKMARIGWAILRHGGAYQPQMAVHH
jgi:transposase